MTGTIRSPLAPLIASGKAKTEAELRVMAEKAWVELGMAVIKPGWLPNAQDRAQLVELVGKVHGERNTG